MFIRKLNCNSVIIIFLVLVSIWLAFYQHIDVISQSNYCLGVMLVVFLNVGIKLNRICTLFPVSLICSLCSWYCLETLVLGRAALFFALSVVSLTLLPRLNQQLTFFGFMNCMYIVLYYFNLFTCAISLHLLPFNEFR